MPPHPKLNRCVILYDLNCKNQRDLRRALLKIYSYFYFRKSKDLVNLVLVNSEKTRNRKQKHSGGGYQHIFEINQERVSFDPTFAHQSIEHKNAEASNWKEAVAVATQILKEDNTPRVISYQILYLTDLSCSSQSSQKLDGIIEYLNGNDIYLYIVGPQVKYPKTITSFKEVNTLTQGICFENENESLVEAKKFVESCNNAVIANVKMGLQFFFNYKDPIGKQVWAVPLTFGSKIKYSVGTSKLMEKCKGFRLKPKNQPLNSCVFTSAEDSTKVYAREDVTRGILRHGKFIPLQNNDMFKVKVEKSFTLVFITKIKYIPEYMMKGPSCNTVTAEKNSSPTAFHCLLMRLEETNSCLIVKRVYSKGSIPAYWALIPVTSKKCFRAIQLPYGSEVLFEWMEEEPQKDSEGVSEPLLDFLEQINIGSDNFSLNCSMTPNVINSARGEALVNLATEKLLGEPRLCLEEVDFDPFSTSIDAEIGERLREIWPSRGPIQTEKIEKDGGVESDDDDINYF